MASLNAQLVCPLCPHERTAHLHFDLTDFLKHMKLFHAHQAGFRVTCGISGCQRSFSNFRTFQNHVSAMHRYQQDPSNVTPGLDRCPGEDTMDDGSGESDWSLDVGEEKEACSQEVLQKSTALFLLGLKEKHKLTQAAVQSVVEGVTSLLQQRLDILHTQVCSKLTEAGVTSLPGLDALFSEDGANARPFLGLETHHQQLKYYKTHFNFIVSTCTIGVGTYCICKTYVPLIYVMATTQFMYPVYFYFYFLLIRNRSVFYLENGTCGRVEVQSEGVSPKKIM